MVESLGFLWFAQAQQTQLAECTTSLVTEVTCCTIACACLAQGLKLCSVHNSSLTCCSLSGHKIVSPLACRQRRKICCHHCDSQNPQGQDNSHACIEQHIFAGDLRFCWRRAVLRASCIHTRWQSDDFVAFNKTCQMVNMVGCIHRLDT